MLSHGILLLGASRSHLRKKWKAYLLQKADTEDANSSETKASSEEKHQITWVVPGPVAQNEHSANTPPSAVTHSILKPQLFQRIKDTKMCKYSPKQPSYFLVWFFWNFLLSFFSNMPLIMDVSALGYLQWNLEKKGGGSPED